MAEEKRIIIYGTKWCPDCYRSKKVFRDRNISFEYIDINRCAESRAYVEKVNKGYRSVPTILFQNGDILVEPSNAELNAKLDILFENVA
jgi:mycoredoxin